MNLSNVMMASELSLPIIPNIPIALQQMSSSLAVLITCTNAEIQSELYGAIFSSLLKAIARAFS
jgi:hypothetical protein